jgi:transketolase C-terminal domain/subunit
MALCALKAQSALIEKGISTGVILLEVLKPYGVTVDNILSLLSSKTRALLFIEEEIRNGGMGMSICDVLSKRNITNYKTRIMAVDDIFVTDRKFGEDIYTSARIDVDSICREAEEILKI